MRILDDHGVEVLKRIWRFVTTRSRLEYAVCGVWFVIFFGGYWSDLLVAVPAVAGATIRVFVELVSPLKEYPEIVEVLMKLALWPYIVFAYILFVSLFVVLPGTALFNVVSVLRRRERMRRQSGQPVRLIDAYRTWRVQPEGERPLFASPRIRRLVMVITCLNNAILWTLVILCLVVPAVLWALRTELPGL